MKKACVYFLLPVLFFHTSYTEVLKFPWLVAHFMQHQEINREISFAGFLSMHYFGHDLNDGDDAEDMKLPFKKMDAHAHICSAIPAETSILLHQPSFSLRITPAVPRQFIYDNMALGTLFRPPRA